MVALHEELTVQVTAIRPWGVEVLTPQGDKGLIDKTKLPSWRGQGNPPAEGDVLSVVVLDETREPFRASALADDMEIARRLGES